MINQDEIWKQMTTPKEIEVSEICTFNMVRSKLNRLAASGVCVRCPMSGTVFNMPYRRSMSRGMARALKVLYRIQVEKTDDGTTPNSFSDFTKLRYWGLIRQDLDSGMWRITPKGIDFVRGLTKCEKYAIVVNNHCTQFMGGEITFSQVYYK